MTAIPPSTLAPASPSATSVLDATQAGYLLQLLAGNDPLHLHFETPLWTLREIIEVIRDEFDLTLAPEDAQRCVAELGILPRDSFNLLTVDERAAYTRWMQQDLPNKLTAAKLDTLWSISEISIHVDNATSLHDATPLRNAQATALVAWARDGRIALLFCRGTADARIRADFLVRLARLGGAAAVLACGLESAYAEAAVQSGVEQLLLLDPRAETEATTPSTGLFRTEVLIARARRLEGEVLVMQPLPLRLLTGTLLLLLVAVVLFAAFGHFARTESARGVLMPTSGVVRLTAPQTGVVASLQVHVGDRVAAGQALVQLTSPHIDASGNAMDAGIVSELEHSLADISAEEDTLKHQNTLEQERLDSARTNAEHQRDDAQHQHAIEVERQKVLEEKLARSRKIADAGLIPKNQLLDIQDQALAAQGQTFALAREQQQAETAAHEAAIKLQQLPLDYSHQLSALEQRKAEIDQRLAQARLSAGVTVTAPQATRVAAVLVRPGETVDTNHTLLLLVDDQVPLQAELFVPSRAIGFIQPGQEVELKLDAFPYQRFGYQHGKVVEIARTALAPGELDAAQPAGGEPVYAVMVALQQQSVSAYGSDHLLSAGMTLNADIVIDRPRIIEWLQEPLISIRGH